MRFTPLKEALSRIICNPCPSVARIPALQDVSSARSLLFVALAFWAASFLALGETAPTINVLYRVTMVESRFDRGSIFSVDVDHREYWITAKHILTGAKHPPFGSVSEKSVSLRVLNPRGQAEQWLPESFSVLDPGKDIDIVVLASAQPILPTSAPDSVATDAVGLMIGSECEFLGFPYGTGWLANRGKQGQFWTAFAKHCTVSGSISDEPKLWILDGINNEGFSGGPVIFRAGSEQKIFAVVSGYYAEPTDVIPSAARKSAPKQKAATRMKVNLNSGFIYAYDIAAAIKAIQRSPIGPIRTGKAP